MKNSIDEQVKQLKKYIMKSFRESNKKHLLITGSKKAGKTTVLKEILKDEENYGGIVTYVIRDDGIPPKYVMLRDINDVDKRGIIARRNNTSTGLNPNIDTFENLGTSILDEYVNSKAGLIVIDEVGFLENAAMEYQKKILQAMDKKKTILALRKEKTLFIEKIISRKDVYLVDLDMLKR